MAVPARQKSEAHRFAEEVGLVFEQTGLPRMSGRIFGWLLIASPPHQSSEQLTQALMASKGSISTMTRLLIQSDLIERLSLPGVRRSYFRLRADAWRHLIRHGFEEEINVFRRLAERGLQLPGGNNPQTRKRLKEMLDVYTYLGREFPTLVQRWQQKTTCEVKNRGKS